jgi:hypothetical protein
MLVAFPVSAGDSASIEFEPGKLISIGSSGTITLSLTEIGVASALTELGFVGGKESSLTVSETALKAFNSLLHESSLQESKPNSQRSSLGEATRLELPSIIISCNTPDHRWRRVWDEQGLWDRNHRRQ